MSYQTSRRDILRQAAMTPLAAQAANQANSSAAKPNILVIISDQFRGDMIGASGQNPMGLTPNLDRMAKRGTMFRSAVCSQPVCAPARATMFTGQYPEKHGVWKNAIPIQKDAKTLATACRDSGYSANYMGKWHLGPTGPDHSPQSVGMVPPEYRGGFLNLWEASNALEWTSHPYEGDVYDADNKPIHFSGVYRTDFMTQRAQRFLKDVKGARDPFLLVLSYLEVHHQNDIDAFVPPKEYAGKYKNPFVPQDLRPLPGSWMEQLGDYCGCIAKMDETVGTILKTLEENNLDKNTIVVFLSDHGCHFKTRNAEYKRSPHESSIHIPLIIQGPGFDRSTVVSEIVSQVDLTPTLLAAAGIPIPGTMQGHSFLPLLDGRGDGWRNDAYITMSENMTGRILRTPQWTYAVAAPKKAGWAPVAASPEYNEYMLYNLAADPFQHVNLAGRAETRAIAAQLKERLLARIQEASGAKAVIGPTLFPYS
jgi:arylsulfatase A-like enzyme